MKTLKEYIDKMTEIDSGEPAEINEDRHELEDMLIELEHHLSSAIDLARQLSRQGRRVSGPFSGQIDAYLVPHLESWASDERQPGSIPRLRGMLEDEYEESNY